MSLEEYVKETLKWEAATSEAGIKFTTDPAGYLSTESDRWELIYRMLTAMSGVMKRLAKEIDDLSAKLGELD